MGQACRWDLASRMPAAVLACVLLLDKLDDGVLTPLDRFPRRDELDDGYSAVLASYVTTR